MDPPQLAWTLGKIYSLQITDKRCTFTGSENLVGPILSGHVWAVRRESGGQLPIGPEFCHGRGGIRNCKNINEYS